MGKAAPSPKPTTAAPPAAAVVENKKPERSQQLTKEPEVVDKSLNTDNDIDDKTLEKVLENILAEVEQVTISKTFMSNYFVPKVFNLVFLNLTFVDVWQKEFGIKLQ